MERKSDYGRWPLFHSYTVRPESTGTENKAAFILVQVSWGSLMVCVRGFNRHASHSLERRDVMRCRTELWFHKMTTLATNMTILATS